MQEMYELSDLENDNLNSRKTHSGDTLCVYCAYISNKPVINYSSLVIASWIMNHGTYRQTSDISRTLVGNKLVDHSDVVGASPIGAAPTISSFTT